MKENELYKAIVDGAKLENIILIKIVDGSVGKKPFDMFGITNKGIAVAVEVKVWRNTNLPGSWSEVDKLYESQQKPWLMEYASNKGVAILALYHEYSKRMLITRVDGSGYYGTVYEMVKQKQVWHGLNQCFTIDELAYGIPGLARPGLP